MNKNRNKTQKSAEEYRRDIFTLKKKLKEEEQHLQDLKQKYQNADVLADMSYTYSMKLKILEYTLSDIRAMIAKFNMEQQFEYYLLNFATLALVKSCEVVGVTKEMIFRGVDVEGKGEVRYFQFSTFLREVMRLDSEFINPLMKALCPDESQPIKKQRYEHFLAAFMIQTEQNGEQKDYLQQSITRVAKELDRQHVELKKIWTIKEINIAIAVYGLMQSAKNLDVLDCVACYCRCDPLKAGTINSSALVNLLQHIIDDSNNYQGGAVKFKLGKR